MDALVIDIREVEVKGCPAYKICVVKQLHTYSKFNMGSTMFVASNGFAVRSVDRIEVRESNSPTGRSWGANALFVRGYGSTDSKWYKVYSQSFIEELKAAVKEYNDFIHYEYVKCMWRF